MSKVRKALAFSFLGANTVTLIQFVATLIIARLLTPEEIGIYSVAAVFIGITAILRDFGVTNYLVQVTELSTETLRSALGLVTIMSASLCLLMYSTSGYIAQFYRTPELQSVLHILAINILLVPLGAITLTLARRNMRFRALSAINVASALMGAVASICLASNDFGPISLAWGGVASTLTSALLSLRLRTSDMAWLPSLRNLSGILRFGAASGGANLIGYINVAASDILLGRMLGMEAVGYFNRSLSLTKFVTHALSSTIHPVLLPWLSEIKRHNEHPRGAYHKVTELTTGLTWPIFATVAVLSDEFILVLFGNQWGESAALVPYICVAACISSAYAVCSPLYNSIGKPSADLVTQTINLPLKVIAVVVLAAYGLEAVAMSWPFVASVGAATHSVMMWKHTGISFYDTLSALKRSAALVFTALSGSLIAVSLLDPSTPASIVLIASSLTAGMSSLTAAALMRHPLIEEFGRLIRRKAVSETKP